MHSRQPPQRLRKVPVRARIIGRPAGRSFFPVRAAPKATTKTTPVSALRRRIHQARELPFSFFLIIGRKRKVFVFAAGILTEGSRLRFFCNRRNRERTTQQNHKTTCGNRRP